MNNKPNIAQRRRARSLLIQALYQWQIAGTAVNEIEAEFRADPKGKIDWDFFHEVLSVMPEHCCAVDEQLSTMIDRKLEELTPVELSILRLGLFELMQRIDVPYRVVINECVDLAKKFGASESHKYINGVLDKAAKQLRKTEREAGA